MDRSSLEVVQELYAAFGEGNMPAMFALLDPDIQWDYPGTADVPWAGSFRGHDEVKKFFDAIPANAEVERFEPHHFIAQDERVVVLGLESLRVKRTGRVYQTHWAHAYTVSDGKITTFRGYTDTAAEEEAFRE